MVSTKLVLIFVVAFGILAAQVASQDPEENSCGSNRTKLNTFCGRGPTRQDCPTGYECIIAPDDSYAFCCSIRTGGGD